MKTIHVPVIIETDEDGIFIVSCPRFKGCHSYGKTIYEALERIREAIAVCMEDSNLEQVNTFVGVREVEIIQGA
jgi:predicted RNase H-like HicB family nuclease